MEEYTGNWSEYYVQRTNTDTHQVKSRTVEMYYFEHQRRMKWMGDVTGIRKIKSNLNLTWRDSLGDLAAYRKKIMKWAIKRSWGLDSFRSRYEPEAGCYEHGANLCSRRKVKNFFTKWATLSFIERLLCAVRQVQAFGVKDTTHHQFFFTLTAQTFLLSQNNAYVALWLWVSTSQNMWVYRFDWLQ